MNSSHDSHGYLFDKDTAANIIYAEALRFTAECSAHGPSEAELQSLARKISWLIDKDINWADLDVIIGYAFELRQLENGTHEYLELNGAYTVDNREQVRSWITTPMFGEIDFMVAGVPTRWELAA
ncbi:hypothetical protein [Pseudarthrobacter sp. NIBRBAC000502771]|uniref:hypothetical protein n=1 Tax=Pseudarthrobacter sp. NIBRBAC000502771 TaxID=2590774 RepID=UPI00113009FE|nr:hypothetical protein [Pseudarthrobacter sp. NIBRBAC000502771]QDG61210.1 hypothetical protein NIBR502771_02070 [Pseudarthrobacter sp. NIBRBAC000502771]